MKKMSKLGKSILLSSLAIIAFGGVAAGSTYALFTSEANTDVSVTTGKVSVTKKVELTDVYSPKSINIDGTIADDTNVAADGKFANGGTATIDENGNVILTGMVAGDSITVKVIATNASTVNIKYRAVVETTDDIKDVVTMTGKAGDEDMKVSENGLFTNYKESSTQGELGVYTLKFEIPADTNVSDGSEYSGTISIKIEAIQGNAAVTDLTEYKIVSTKDDLMSAVSAINDGSANAGSIIEVDKAIILENTLTVTNDMTLVLDADITAPADSSAVEVTSGTLTIGESATTSSGDQTVKAARKYSKNSSASITSTTNAIEAVGNGKVIVNGGTITSTGKEGVGLRAYDGGTVILNDGDISSSNGNAIGADKGTVVVNGGNITAREFGAVIHNQSSLEVNGGTFTTYDNVVIGTNGTTGWGGNTITITGGTFNGNIESKGYVACGVYVANNDTVNITGGTFNITDGCGVLARSGKTTIGNDVKFNFVTKDTSLNTGIVGDSRVVVPVKEEIVQDFDAKYPGGAPVVSAEGRKISQIGSIDLKEVGTFKDLNTVLSSSGSSNKYVRLTEDITATDTIKVYAQSCWIDFDGHNYTLNGTTEVGFEIYTTATLINGTIDGTAIKQEADDSDENEVDAIYANHGSNVGLHNMIITVDSKTGSCVFAGHNGKATINSGTYTNQTDIVYPYNDLGWKGMLVNQQNKKNQCSTHNVVENDKQLIFIKGGTFVGVDPALGDDANSVSGVKTFLASGYKSVETSTGSGKWVVSKE